ncbi:MAG: hypothetical protein BMS9Abin26_1013 [Gammaproteobacteria bacterium]|nr:MAG: hypothetical protein BMS9Abin26_1013 [Gammaproteobacteria bacterium]
MRFTLLIFSVFMYQFSYSDTGANSGPARYNDYNSYGQSYNQSNGQWSNKQDDLTRMTNELDVLVNKAEKARAADPRFLRDLKNLSSRYKRQWTTEILFDDFRDGDFSKNPVWKLVEGTFWVDVRNGLRSKIDPASHVSSNKKSEEKEDLGKLLLGALLEELDKKKDKQAEKQPYVNAGRAVLLNKVKITGAYTVRTDISSSMSAGRLEMVLYQNDALTDGYKLIYYPGSQRGLELIRVTHQNSQLIQRYNKPVKLEDNRSHRLEWSRDINDQIKVSLDGKLLFSVIDRSYRGNYNGFAFINGGGDYSIRKISITGR